MPIPAVVELFFSGTPLSSKAEDLAAQYADEFSISFVGPFAGAAAGMVMDKQQALSAMGNLAASFPDLTFNAKEAPVEQFSDGGGGSNIVVKGTHRGGAYSLMPGQLPAIPTSGIEVALGPELFTMYTNSEGKATALTIEALHEGALVGPPGFYVSIGGSLPGAPAPEASVPAPAPEKPAHFGYGTGRMLQNINGCDNFFDAQPPVSAVLAGTAADDEYSAPSSAPAPDPTGVSLLSKSLLPFDEHPFSQSLRSNPRKMPGAVNPEVERRVTAERRGRGGGSAQTSSLGPSHTYHMHYSKLATVKGAFPDNVSGYAGHVSKPEIVGR